MRKFALIYLFFLVYTIHSNAQNVFVNIGVDTINVEKEQVVKLWINYLHSKPDSLYDNPYWNNSDKKRYKSYDFLKSEGFFSPSLYYFNWANRILSITQLGQDFLVKSMFYGKQSGNVFAITNVLAKKEGTRFFLCNYLPFYTSNWLSQNVGIIKYHYHPYHPFDENKANKANDFISKICKLFSIKVDSINYYIAPDCDEVFKLKGFDYIMGMGNDRDCAFFDRQNYFVYSTSLGGEDQQHELTHIINNYFPKTHGLLLAGIAAYLGGENAHNAKPLIYHIKRVNEYLIKHPEIDLNKPTEFWQLDSETNPQYVLGAILCDKAIQIGGLGKLKALFNCGISDEDLIFGIEKELNIPKSKLNDFFRKTIREMSNKSEFRSDIIN